jgi:hypothetical protein
MHGSIRDAYRILIGKPKGKRPLGRLRRNRGYITKKYLEV